MTHKQSPADDAPLDCWSQWWGHRYVSLLPSPPHIPPHTHRHYSLHVVQHPLRARMCGFGDKVRPRHATLFRVFIYLHKDRRPLAPAAVAKMVVRREDNSIVDVESVSSPPPPPHPPSLNVHSELDASFFLVTVDLWSADAKREMNLVLHPSSSTDRHVSTVSAKPKKPRASIPSTTSPRSDHPSPPSSHSTPNSAPDPHRPSLDSQVSASRSPRADKLQSVPSRS